jgi:hypothetical protein
MYKWMEKRLARTKAAPDEEGGFLVTGCIGTAVPKTYHIAADGAKLPIIGATHSVESSATWDE